MEVTFESVATSIKCAGCREMFNQRVAQVVQSWAQLPVRCFVFSPGFRQIAHVLRRERYSGGEECFHAMCIVDMPMPHSLFHGSEQRCLLPV